MPGNKISFKVKIICPNLDKSFIGIKHGGIRGSKHVASDEGDTVAVLVVAVCVSSLLIPSTTLVYESVAADQKTVANIVPAL